MGRSEAGNSSGVAVVDLAFFTLLGIFNVLGEAKYLNPGPTDPTHRLIFAGCR